MQRGNRDFNSRVKKKDPYTEIIDRYDKDTRNNNDKQMLKYCLLNNLIVTNIFYKHKAIHKYIRKKPIRNKKSIIDYILIEISHKNQIPDVPVKSGHEINNDQHLLEIKKKRLQGKPN